jgi:hypothetical protein
MVSASLATSATMLFAISSGVHYAFEWIVLFRSAATTNGVRLGLVFPAATYFGATVRIPVAADATGGEFQGQLTSSGDAVIGTGVEATGTTYVATIDGVINASANGNLQLVYGSELTTGSGIVIKQGSHGILRTLP